MGIWDCLFLTRILAIHISYRIRANFKQLFSPLKSTYIQPQVVEISKPKHPRSKSGQVLSI